MKLAYRLVQPKTRSVGEGERERESVDDEAKSRAKEREREKETESITGATPCQREGEREGEVG